MAGGKLKYNNNYNKYKWDSFTISVKDKDSQKRFYKPVICHL